MAYSIRNDEVIVYPASALLDFTVAAYDWIDSLLFTRNPGEFVQDVEDYLAIARQRFIDAGWKGDGEVRLMWVPPFALPVASQISQPQGVIVWHVKQESDGTSWLLYPPGEWRW